MTPKAPIPIAASPSPALSIITVPNPRTAKPKVNMAAPAPNDQPMLGYLVYLPKAMICEDTMIAPAMAIMANVPFNISLTPILNLLIITKGIIIAAIIIANAIPNNPILIVSIIPGALALESICEEAVIASETKVNNIGIFTILPQLIPLMALPISFTANPITTKINDIAMAVMNCVNEIG